MILRRRPESELALLVVVVHGLTESEVVVSEAMKNLRGRNDPRWQKGRREIPRWQTGMWLERSLSGCGGEGSFTNPASQRTARRGERFDRERKRKKDRKIGTEGEKERKKERKGKQETKANENSSFVFEG